MHQSDTIVLKRGRPLQVSVDGGQSKQAWTTALTVDEALKQLSIRDAAPDAASRFSRVPLAGMVLSLVSVKKVHIVDGGVASDRRLAAPPEIVSKGTSPRYQAAADAAMRAVLQGQPFDMLQTATYDSWKDMIVTFDPRQMFRS